MWGEVYLVGTGLPVIGGRVRSAQSVLEDMVLKARQEILIAAYTMSGNLKDFFKLLEDAATRGVTLRIVVNRLEKQPESVRRFLYSLSRKYPHAMFFSYEGDGELHMKVIVTDRKKALVGSANLTWKGLIENLELCVFIERRPARIVAEVLERVIESSRSVNLSR